MRATAGSDKKLLLSVMGALEAATGLVLLVAPSMLVELLLGAPPGTSVGVTVSRVAGAALLSLGVACWLARNDAASATAKGLIAAMLLYNVGAVVVLVPAWISPGLSGIAFWPVVLAHTGLAAWCVVCLVTRAPKENSGAPRCGWRARTR